MTDLDGERSDNPTDADRVRPLTPDSTAYLIYTSGTTGQPKGVPVPHRPIAEYFCLVPGRLRGGRRRPGCCRWPRRASTFPSPRCSAPWPAGPCRRAPPRWTVRHRLPDRPAARRGHHRNAFRAVTARAVPVATRCQPVAHPCNGCRSAANRCPVRSPTSSTPPSTRCCNAHGPTETVVNASRFKVEGAGTRITYRSAHPRSTPPCVPARRRPRSRCRWEDRRDLHRRNACGMVTTAVPA